MKKLILILVAVLSLTAVAAAQPRALGVRGGWPVGELSYQHSLGSNFLEFDLGWYAGDIDIAGVYDFVFASANIFNFYVGPGAMLGIVAQEGANEGGGFKMNLGLVGQLGVEAAIPSIPLNISLDWRPTLFSSFHGTYWGGVALGIRYRF